MTYHAEQKHGLGVLTWRVVSSAGPVVAYCFCQSDAEDVARGLQVLREHDGTHQWFTSEDGGIMDEWRPIETAPKEADAVFLVSLANGVVRLGLRCVEELDDDERWIPGTVAVSGGSFWDSYPSSPATHWMPLPEPPQ